MPTTGHFGPVLHICRDPLLAQSRAEILSQCNLKVATAGTAEQAKLHLLQERFAIAIICHTYSFVEQYELRAFLSALQPSLRFLLLDRNGVSHAMLVNVAQSIHPSAMVAGTGG
jgi:hypothetical protein